ncbi:GT2 family glycosyltransferase/glycosyltransferase involved in cell wall biosynthesis [Amycolatopsis bartoniae]|uniref:Glycosyl transferase n=1 Tax=Amycolatopsis bartoniae TaxID=941986 RepID=A0A8H9J507_9PSEU|nr:glycosyltransferase [Amycolatopsis bartoniae]MBB2937300.1 GT2 family glycosyltransferase/glycosyltransferase involved in cell wall biosynthesis [Amycolatopsis bartoniae]TVT07940.1 glycosyltransferase [Amycolatopsis bartoniae]GHF77982.1 glycosyl transferase [Amycolatopsis bartoniae]
MSQGDTPLPLVSVIVVNYRGASDTITCLRALADDLDYPRLEILVVDNASGGDDVARIKAALPDVKLIESPTNLGFAGGCNLGAKQAQGSVLAFLNNDARPHPGWARAAVAALAADPTVAAVASKVLDWDGTGTDFVDAGLTWFGMGYKRHAGRPVAEVPSGEHETAKDVLFATGSAMFVRAGVFAELGGFDERFFMFYEDVDLGWRLNLRGWRVRYVPESLAYHRHHATMSEVDAPDTGRETFLLERNALAALYKNVSDETLAKVLPAALALAIRRATARGELDATQLDLAKGVKPVDTTPVEVPRTTLAGVLAVDQFVELLPSLAESRKAEQAARVRTDADLVPLLRKALEPAYPLPRYLAAHEILVEAFGIESVFGQRRKVLVITGDAITDRMAGPAIRAWNIASVLAPEHDVRLVTVNPLAAPPPAPFPVSAARKRDLTEPIEWADVVILQGHVLEMAPALKAGHSNKIVVCDLYDPMHLELLEQGKSAPDDRRAADLAGVTRVLDAQLERGDFFLCASERQRHFWLGHLAALGRLTPRLYDADPTTQSLLAVVPFGLPAEPPVRTAPGLRSTLGLTDTDHVVLWAGGVYSWFDPLTLVDAIDRLRQRRPDVRLVFLGMKHPNPEVAEMDIGARTMQLADRLGMTGKHVFFNEHWVPYGERQNWLLDADCGVTTHFEHVETTFAFRTRVLDYLWSGLPIVTTDGDAFADLVREEKLGVVVPAEDADALADALERAMYDTEFAEACKERIAVVAQRFAWPQALKPLVEFCRNPRPAADRLVGAADLTVSDPLRGSEMVRRDLALVREYLADGGPKELARRVAGRLRKVARSRG